MGLNNPPTPPVFDICHKIVDIFLRLPFINNVYFIIFFQDFRYTVDNRMIEMIAVIIKLGKSSEQL